MNSPRLLAIITIIIWSFGGIAAKQISVKSEYLFVALSFSFTFLTFLTWLFITKRYQLMAQIKLFKPQFLFFGLFGYAIYWICMIQSFRNFSSASGPIVLNYTWPLFTVLFSELVFKTSMTVQINKSYTRAISYFGLLIGVFGVVVLAGKGDLSLLHIDSPRGILWGLGSGASYGLFSAYSGTVKSEEHQIFLFTSITISLLFIAVIMVSTIGNEELKLINQISLTDIMAITFIGIVCDGIGYFTWTKSNRRIEELKLDRSMIASMMFSLPILSVIIISLFLGEVLLLELYFIIALLLIVFSSVLCQKAKGIAAYFSNKELMR